MAAKRRFLGHDGGAATVEFAMVLPVFLVLLVGGFFCAFLLFTAGGLHYAVERAARCASVQTTVCSSANATRDYALTQFSGYGAAPTFTATTAACGHQVSGSVVFDLNFYVRRVAVPLSASACYP